MREYLSEIIAHIFEKRKDFFESFFAKSKPLPTILEQEVVSLEERNAKQEQQIWQRVFAQPRAAGQEDLRGLQLSVMELMAIYRHLYGEALAKSRDRIRSLFRGERENLACLRGMCRLSGGAEGKEKTMTVPKLAAEKLLQLCYHKTRQAMAEYTARSVDPEFGEVFRQMAQREGEHCAILVQLLGDGR